MSERTSYKNRLIKRRKRQKFKRQKTKPVTSEHGFAPVKSGSSFFLGKNGQYELTEGALRHIIDGEYAERLVTENGHRTGQKETILTGGLHTCEGWLKFKKIRKDVVHLRFFNSLKDKYWYFARELQNGVITLKLPLDLFQNQAANITKPPETYYKSGYLWKTLFPKGKSEQEILSIIDEALRNLDKEESSENILIGYALRKHPFTAIKIRIQVRGNKIFSAFPTWDQPLTGNNGKAYSQFDSSGFTMAASTVFFDDINLISTPLESKIYIHKQGVDSIVKNTPRFLVERPPISEAGCSSKWHALRKHQLENYAKKVDEPTIEEIKEYLSDNLVCKEGFYLQSDFYSQHGDKLNNNHEMTNALCFTQNIIESLIVMAAYDQTNKTIHLKESVAHFLSNKITFSGFLDSWNNKRIHTCIANLVGNYHCSSIIPTYISSLANSPSRIDLYTEFDLNRYWKKELDLTENDDRNLISLMHHPEINLKMGRQHFDDYILRNLSENYLIFFTAEDRISLAKKLISYRGKGYEHLVCLTTGLSSPKDFEFFPETFVPMIDRMNNADKQETDTRDLLRICKDYFRIQTAQRMKITLENLNFDPDNIDYSDNQSEQYRWDIIIKHERLVKVTMLEKLLNKTIEFAIDVGEERLINNLREMVAGVWNERPPLQKFIPDYIEHWRNQEDKSWQKDTVNNLSDAIC